MQLSCICKFIFVKFLFIVLGMDAYVCMHFRVCILNNTIKALRHLRHLRRNIFDKLSFESSSHLSSYLCDF